VKQNAFTVNIKKAGTTSLGLNTVQRGDGIFVKNIIENSPASQCDNIRPGLSSTLRFHCIKKRRKTLIQEREKL
jgi:hypothetical protein